MKLSTKPESVMERIALLLNLAPLPLVDTQIAFSKARAIMAAQRWACLRHSAKATRRPRKSPPPAEQIEAQQNGSSIVWSALAMRAGLTANTACDVLTANGCCAPVRTPS